MAYIVNLNNVPLFLMKTGLILSYYLNSEKEFRVPIEGECVFVVQCMDV